MTEVRKGVLAIVAASAIWGVSSLYYKALAGAGKVESFGRGRACRWLVPAVPGFPTSLLL